ncbi:MAG TPA: GvpL/GvpF family gas vesicle protein [Amycolatopsis sp.]|uniref:GvpL/GvpF family gas vesicle protein n=1 Tax=Amycolatopsis sp. TaxID=37632 RepID=UPI002B473857|nr:GvpL/GvpF family gas vesicle protein [Amycolatopsis sp.]HKS49758.1 GvpL/GvpF family gas vesicle protein [Amycolatopsis sp.]
MPETAVYVYGIVPADVETDPDARGVRDAGVHVVRQGEIAALVSPLTGEGPLGRPEDLTAHAALLDGAAAEVPVLPLRFGAALADEQAVVDELLSAHHDEFAAAIAELEGKAQYVIKGRYDEAAILSEILAENEQVVQLRQAIQGKPDDATRNERIALGEQINNAIEAKRQADTQAVADVLTRHGVLLNVREPTHEEDAVHIACLSETAKQADLESSVGELARAWEGRVKLRLLGPLAPYDFVVGQSGEQ